ncbi:GGDEF domain-containing protein [Acetobacterium wieringae]|uniref:GGDEF domain-containing protein n=1 Tax=Acetobacterium wieringae TaxID=52694 RepID=UPI0026EF30B6|nr:GGDEF domain-containing protein [Acetobacterium wieringae]
MKTLHSVIRTLKPYAAYEKTQSTLLRKTLMCDNVKRLKIIGIIGSSVNLLLLVLYYLDSGFSGLTTIEATLRISWILASIIYIIGVGSPYSPEAVKKRQFIFFYSATGLCLLFASLITAVLSVEQGSTFLYLINVLLIGSFLYLSLLEVICIILPSFLVLVLSILFTPGSILLVQGNFVNVIASTAFAVVIAQTILTSKLTQLASTQTILDQKKELEYLIDLDGLTRIPNRRKLESYYLNHPHTSFALLMVDIDYFKNYNDTYGHLQGDQCLIQVAQCLSHYPFEGLTTRYGGEEFVTIIVPTDLARITTLVEAIRQSIEALQIRHEASPFGVVTVSIGYVVHVVANTCRENHSNEATALEDFILKADQALYQAKENGRNQIKRYQE